MIPNFCVNKIYKKRKRSTNVDLLNLFDKLTVKCIAN